MAHAENQEVSFFIRVLAQKNNHPFYRQLVGRAALHEAIIAGNVNAIFGNSHGVSSLEEFVNLNTFGDLGPKYYFQKMMDNMNKKEKMEDWELQTMLNPKLPSGITPIELAMGRLSGETRNSMIKRLLEAGAIPLQEEVPQAIQLCQTNPLILRPIPRRVNSPI